MSATAAGMSPDEARGAILAGAPFGAVYDLVAESERAGLAEWFVREPGVPTPEAVAERMAALRADSPPPEPVVHSAPLPSPTGELCTRCGGFLVRTGSCLTCQSCGTSSGGCG